MSQLEADIRRIESSFLRGVDEETREWVIAVPRAPMGDWSSQYMPSSDMVIFNGTKAEATRTFDRKYVERYNYMKNTKYVSLCEIIAMGVVDSETRDWIEDLRDISSECGGTCDDLCGVGPRREAVD